MYKKTLLRDGFFRNAVCMALTLKAARDKLCPVCNFERLKGKRTLASAFTLKLNILACG